MEMLRTSIPSVTPVDRCENKQVSGCASFVTMMKPADLWNLDDDAFAGWLNFSGFR